MKRNIKLKCVFSQDNTFVVGNVYTSSLEVIFGSEVKYLLSIDGKSKPLFCPLNGFLWRFEIVTTQSSYFSRILDFIKKRRSH
jgi:hypothetical protein